MKIIDFDAPFRAALAKWMKQNVARGEDVDALEERAGEVYFAFNNAPADWLDGLTPAMYFAQFGDAAELVDALTEYDRAGIDVPELLLSRITQLGDAAISPLAALMRDDSACPHLRVTAINLLIELDTIAPLDDCFRLIDDAADEDEVAEAAGELLQNAGAAAVPGMLKRLDGATGPALRTYLDLLCNFPGDERIYTYTEREFLRDTAHRALYAALLGRLGDARALEPLRRVMGGDDLNYLDYLEIANAIERLGGDPGARDRDFSGDPYYESLSHMD